DRLQLLLADSGDRQELLRLPIHHLEHLLAELREDLRGQMSADSADRTGSKPCFDRRTTARRGDPDRSRLKLLSSLRVLDPLAVGNDALTLQDVRRDADDP